MRALLWDIDGTLTRSKGAGTRALAATLHARPAALEELRKMRLDGMTDRAIVRILLAAELGHLLESREPAQGVVFRDPDEARELAALPIEARMQRVRESEIEAVLAGYLAALSQECAQGAFTPQPGIDALIPHLAAREGILLGLCTGNLERGAELKLGSARLWSHFSFGGYGSDAEPRPLIVKKAWERAQARGATEALVIDDTPRGILAAHEAGLPACGVATGRFTTHDLGVHGAEIVVESFADLERSVALLLGPLPKR